ncbi:hypothetical protein B0H21DRAFT_730653 [Amylocystis lapponica]|nr:hypothetical protein B0H21DRAFT_730653 [Amylocystis lapponica]
MQASWPRFLCAITTSCVVQAQPLCSECHFWTQDSVRHRSCQLGEPLAGQPRYLSRRARSEGPKYNSRSQAWSK